MTKNELVERIWTMNPMLTKCRVADIIDEVFDEIRIAIVDDKRFTMPKFGTFTVRHRKARRGVNPVTGLHIKIPASRTVGFRPTALFKEVL